MKKGDRVVIVGSKFGIDNNLIDEKGFISSIPSDGVFDYFVNLDNHNEMYYPFYVSEIEIVED